jgi:hypothetical protein
MFCPRCAQEQVNPEIRFCSRCGFPLSDVAEALDKEGYVDRNTTASINGLRLRVSIGLVMMTLSLAFLIASLVIGSPEPSYVIQLNLLVTLIVFLLGLSWIGHSLWRGFSVESVSRQKVPETGREFNDVVTAQLEQPDVAALPEAYVAPADAGRQLEPVTSVTENTTKFLGEER